MPRRAHWAGQFYTGNPEVLGPEIDAMIASWPEGGVLPWALIVPHAGYLYSGKTAAAAYALIAGTAVKRVILIGPSHHKAVAGFALSFEESWTTPLGHMRADADAARRLLATGYPFSQDEAAIAREHSLEVQIPFLQRCLAQAEILPILMGSAGEAERSAVRKQLREIARPGDLWLISTDLSHFHTRLEAERLDSEAERLIAAGDAGAFAEALAGGRVEACGAGPVLLLLEEAGDRRVRVEILDRSDSADASGDESNVVGYLAAAFLETS